MLLALHTQAAVWLITALSVGFVVITAMFLCIVDWAFSSRLKDLVAQHVRGGSKCTAGAHTTAADNKALNRNSTLNGMQQTFHAIRDSNVQDFAQVQRPLLMTAATGTVLALWTSVAAVIFMAAMILWSLHKCNEVLESTGHILMCISTTIVSASLLFGLKLFQTEYQRCCFRCDSLVVKLVVFTTQRRAEMMGHPKPYVIKPTPMNPAGNDDADNANDDATPVDTPTEV